MIDCNNLTIIHLMKAVNTCYAGNYQLVNESGKKR